MHRPKLHKGYVPGRWGQVHYRAAGEGRTLICLHATAYSSRSLIPLLDALARRGRRAIGLDTPGYGQSDPPPARPHVAEYAAALAQAIAGLADGPVDLFGYHTGALLAAEIAAAHPALVRRAVLIGVPAFTPAEKPAWQARLVRPAALAPSLDQFRERWEYLVTQRPDGLSLADAVANFADELHVAPNESWAHAALFDYDSAPRLAAIVCPVLVINPAGALAVQSRYAASLIAGAVLAEMPALHGAIFAVSADQIAETMESFLA